MPIRQISFGDLSTADLIVDAIYKGGSANNAGDDPIAKLLPCELLLLVGSTVLDPTMIPQNRDDNN